MTDSRKNRFKGSRGSKAGRIGGSKCERKERKRMGSGREKGRKVRGRVGSGRKKGRK